MIYIIQIDVQRYDPETGEVQGEWLGQKNHTEECRDAVAALMDTDLPILIRDKLEIDSEGWSSQLYDCNGCEPVDDCCSGIFTAYKR